MIFNKLYKREADVLNLVDRSLKSKSSLTLTYMNQHCFNIYCSNKEYKNLLDSEFKVFLDGVGIYLMLKLFGYKDIQRFKDMTEKIFNYFLKQGSSLYLIGGRFDDGFIENAKSQKEINIVGYQNGFFSEIDFPSIVENIKTIAPDVIFIGMGVPKQELYAWKLGQMVENKIIICVGNFFDYIFRVQKRAPKIIRYTGFEWLFRLITEPARLWKRYIVGIPLFFYNILKMKLSFK